MKPLPSHQISGAVTFLFIFLMDGVGVGGVGGLIISISMFVLLLKPRQYSPHISRKY